MELLSLLQHIDADKTFSEAYVSTASSYTGNHLLSQFAQAPLKDIDKPLLYKLLYIRKDDKPISKHTVERWYQALSDDIGIKFTSHDRLKLARQ